jgi:hypothetical protein
MSAQQEPKYEGWGAFGPDSIKGNFKWFEYEPKTFCDDDIECGYPLTLRRDRADPTVKIQYCGVCASDLHTASSGWGDMTEMYPQVVGHEIVGEVLRVGDKVDKNIKVGDIVGVGAQCDSCQDCEYCDKGKSDCMSLTTRLMTLQEASSTATLVTVAPTPVNSIEIPPPRVRSLMEVTPTTGEDPLDSSSPSPTTSIPLRLLPCYVEELPSTRP